MVRVYSCACAVRVLCVCCAVRAAPTAQSSRLLLSSDLLRALRLACAEVAACSCRRWLISLAARQVRTPYMLVQQHDYVLQVRVKVRVRVRVRCLTLTRLP